VTGAALLNAVSPRIHNIQPPVLASIVSGKLSEFMQVEHNAFKELLFRWHKELKAAFRSYLDGHRRGWEISTELS